jgi:MerR family transcriptional regulator, thiopeptide resistance regulator
MWGRPCPAERYAGLAELYLEHPDFVARYEQIAPGFAVYLAKAMKLHAGKHAR